jgi:NADPH-dependent 2,4-dienoyl-CoA reductase/sulfur reductase-like enzyme
LHCNAAGVRKSFRGAEARNGTQRTPEQRIAEERVIIAGAGPVGLVAAAHLVRHDVPVTVLEAGLDLSAESRASTLHPATLDMLA